MTGKIIKHVRLSSNEATIGESIRVDVEVFDPMTEVKINRIPGKTIFLQFETAGKQKIMVNAVFDSYSEDLEKHIVIQDRPAHQKPSPIIWATLDPHHLDVVRFSIPNDQIEIQDVMYNWDFGDGIEYASESSQQDHIYIESLDQNKEVTTFHVHVEAKFKNGSVTGATRTIGIFNLYAYNKIRNGTLTPQISIVEKINLPTHHPLLPLSLFCVFKITNVEDEELIFTKELVEWLYDSEKSDSAVPKFSINSPSLTKIDNELLIQSPISSVVRNLVSEKKLIVQDKNKKIGQEFGQFQPNVILKVPPKSFAFFTLPFLSHTFDGDIFGFAIHLSGSAARSNLRAIVSGYFEMRSPYGFSRRLPRTHKDLDKLLSHVIRLNRVQGKEKVTIDDFSEFILRKSITNKINPLIRQNTSSQKPISSFLGSTIKKDGNTITGSSRNIYKELELLSDAGLSSDKIEKLLDDSISKRKCRNYIFRDPNRWGM